MDLLPCPFCGCKSVFTYLTFTCAVIECQECGARPKNNCACVCYTKGKPPKELEGVPTYEATALRIRKDDGSLVDYPEHGYVGVNCMDAFAAYGGLQEWNRRVKS